MKIILICGSLRKESYNKKVLELASSFIEKQGVEAVKVDLQSYSVPLYNRDDEASQGIPEAVLKLGKLITESDGIILVSPEYNGGVASPLKHIVDWVSRINPNPWSNKSYCLMGATIGGFGTVKSMMQLIQILNQMKGIVFPESFSLSFAQKAFNEEGKFLDEKNQVYLEKTLISFINYIKD